MSPKSLTIHQILDLLPHRYPFVFIDSIVDYELGVFLTAIKNVTYNEPFFAGHFPDNPVMPGVLILEALAQASVVLANLGLSEQAHKSTIHLFAGIDEARFKRVVKPGDQLRLDVRTLKYKRGVWKMQATASVDGELACSAILMSAQKDKE